MGVVGVEGENRNKLELVNKRHEMVRFVSMTAGILYIIIIYNLWM